MKRQHTTATHVTSEEEKINETPPTKKQKTSQSSFENMCVTCSNDAGHGHRLCHRCSASIDVYVGVADNRYFDTTDKCVQPIKEVSLKTSPMLKLRDANYTNLTSIDMLISYENDLMGASQPCLIYKPPTAKIINVFVGKCPKVAAPTCWECEEMASYCTNPTTDTFPQLSVFEPSRYNVCSLLNHINKNFGEEAIIVYNSRLLGCVPIGDGHCTALSSDEINVAKRTLSERLNILRQTMTVRLVLMGSDAQRSLTENEISGVDIIRLPHPWCWKSADMSELVRFWGEFSFDYARSGSTGEGNGWCQ